MPIQSQSSIHTKFFTKVPFLRFFWKKLYFQIFKKKTVGLGSCSTSSRAGTRLTVHRALPPYGCTVQLVGGPKNVDLFVIWGAFLFKLMRSFPENSVKKKTRELFGYSFSRWKWKVQDPGNFAKFSDFQDFQDFLKFFLFQNIIWTSSLEDLGGEVGSTSPPGGNQVDGLPPASSNDS